jgi:hypothetical protein
MMITLFFTRQGTCDPPCRRGSLQLFVKAEKSFILVIGAHFWTRCSLRYGEGESSFDCAESSVSTHTHSLLNIPPLDQSTALSLGTMASCALSARCRDPMAAATAVAAPQPATRAPCLAMRLRSAAQPLHFSLLRSKVSPRRAVRHNASCPCAH